MAKIIKIAQLKKIVQILKIAQLKKFAKFLKFSQLKKLAKLLKFTRAPPVNFFDSIAFPFRIWQATCLSPFVLSEIPGSIQQTLRKFYFPIGVLIISVYSLIISYLMICYFNLLTDHWISTFLNILCVIRFFAVIIILAESYLMRMDQRKLFIQINAIDSFLLNQMGIRLDYPAERQRHFIQFMRWMLIKGSAVVYGVLSRPPQQEGLLFSTIFISYHFVVFIITLSMYQFVTLVDIVGSRYRAINDHINNVVLNDPRRKTENEYFLTDVLTSATEECHSEDDEDEQLQEKFHFLQQLREVSHSLDGVTQEINRIFGASLAAFTFKSAMNLIILAYFSFEVAVSQDSVYMFLGACVHTFVRIYDIRKISNACEYTTEQVSSLEFILIMVIYFYLMVFFL